MRAPRVRYARVFASSRLFPLRVSSRLRVLSTLGARNSEISPDDYHFCTACTVFDRQLIEFHSCGIYHVGEVVLNYWIAGKLRRIIRIDAEALNLNVDSQEVVSSWLRND